MGIQCFVTRDSQGIEPEILQHIVLLWVLRDWSFIDTFLLIVLVSVESLSVLT